VLSVVPVLCRSKILLEVKATGQQQGAEVEARRRGEEGEGGTVIEVGEGEVVASAAILKLQ
jgi:hypothetical protein